MKDSSLLEDPTSASGSQDGNSENDSLSTLASTDTNVTHPRHDHDDSAHTPQSAMPSSPPSSPMHQHQTEKKKAAPQSTFLPMADTFINDDDDEEQVVVPLSPPPPPRIILRSSSSSSPPQKTKTTVAEVISTARVARVPNRHLPATAVRIAIDMRTRSSRLFFVLLHLVGVSTNVPSRGSSSYGGSSSSSSSNTGSSSSSYSIPTTLLNLLQQHHPQWLTWSTGIIGVHPTAILLEQLNLSSSRRGLKGILERVERIWGWNVNTDLLGTPYWFQDNVNGLCLGPNGGFSECGDATLWRLRQRPLTKRQLREKRYKKRTEDRKVAREGKEKQQQQQQHSSTTTSTEHRKRNEQPPSSSVCVWPFFCEQDSPILQPSTDTEYDEVYGFEYEKSTTIDGIEGFALQLVDIDAITANASFSSGKRVPGNGMIPKSARKNRTGGRLFGSANSQDEEEEDDEDAECLLSLPASGEGSTLQVGPCSSNDAWVWHVNRDGILVRGSTKAEKRRRKRKWRIAPRRASSAAAAADGSGRLAASSSSQADFGCVHRTTNSTMATLLPCDGDRKQLHEDGGDTSLVGFSLVRYPSTVVRNAPRRRITDAAATDNAESTWGPWTVLEASSSATQDISQTPTAKEKANGHAEEQHLPTSRTNSQNQASAGAKHRNKVDLKSTASMLHTSIEPGAKAKKRHTSASHIRDAPAAINGVAFHNQLSAIKDGPTAKGGLSYTKLSVNKNKDNGKGQTRIHEEKESQEARGSGDHHHHHHHGSDSAPHRPRKIPVHPYIQSSKDFVWVDPLTSLEYPTDLCRYLGHTKKEAGRHTLMGVGQYYRTAFNIKVYGAALYVAKRDVLADPKFGEYATLSSEELRNRDDFYDHLMSMPSPEEDPATAVGGFFDRTLFIKINMQLSTDAMRKSLEADWSLLDGEMKNLIIGSSFEERMADERMQQRIQSKENSSNCSCGQLAEPELNADPSCCARGTELVFTWRKNGEFEIRLDGRLMEIFPRPDIARGIFTEYLNDNPISHDAKAHFADGFPFLLAPLAQVKGMSSAVPNQPHESPKKAKSPAGHSPMHRLMGAAAHSVGAMNNQAHVLSKWMQDGASEMSSTAIGSAMGVARGLSEELDKQRMDLVESALAIQKEGIEMLSSMIKDKEDNDLALTIVNQAMPSLSPFSSGYENYNDDIGMRTAPHQIMPDEIGIKIEPTMNFTHQLFFTTVHIYLFLMLIVSLPGSYTTRLVVRRRISETKKFVQSRSQGAFAAMSKFH